MAFVRFGPFEASLQGETLRRNGTRVPLQQQPFHVLAMLLERPGEIVTREELRQRLWRDDLHVDFEHSLNTAIKKLRLALHDSPEHPRYLETVRGRGYRFVASVERAEQPLESRGAETARRAPLRPWLWLGAAALAVVAVAAATVLVRSRRAPVAPAPRMVPLTSYPGREYQPTFSPDGSHFAFLWHRDASYDIYVQPVGVLKPWPLTEGPEVEYSPAWSPDGHSIAFVRRPAGDAGRASVLVKPPFAGPERVVTEYAFPGGGAVHHRQLAWAPDSRHLVLSRPDDEGPTCSRYRVDASRGEATRLTESPARDSMPALSPDGRRLAFVRQAGSHSEIYVMSLSPGLTPADRPRVLVGAELLATVQLNDGLAPTWTSDGSEIVFAAFPRGPHLFRVDASGARRVRRIPAIGDLLLEPTFRPRTGQLAYASWTSSTTILRLEITPGAGTSATPVAFNSTRNDFQPRFSPDGRTVAFASDRLGARAIWLSRPDGSGLRQLVPLGEHPAWSPDGQWMAYTSGTEVGRQTDVFVIPALGGQPRLLTLDPGDDRQPAWSPDGQWIYFVSSRGGGAHVWRQPSSGGVPERVSRVEGTEPALSADGRLLFARAWPKEDEIWRMPAAGGAAEVVLKSVDPYTSWCVTRSGIYFFRSSLPGDRPELLRYDLAAAEIRRLAVVDGALSPGLTVSPDEAVVLFARNEQLEADLQMLERPLLE
jgi:Tol biopolymer transport system component/DNA-binding winged helix-turn-helix (wHTH) protein